MPAKIGLVLVAGAFKMDYMDQICSMCAGCPEGMKALIDMEMDVVGMIDCMQSFSR